MFLEDCPRKILNHVYLSKVIFKKKTFYNGFSYHQMMTSQRSKEQSPFIHPFHKYLFKIYSLPGIVLGGGKQRWIKWTYMLPMLQRTDQSEQGHLDKESSFSK